MPFLMSVLPSRIELDAFALEHELDVGERRAAVGDEVRGAASGGS